MLHQLKFTVYGNLQKKKKMGGGGGIEEKSNQQLGEKKVRKRTKVGATI